MLVNYEVYKSYDIKGIMKILRKSLLFLASVNVVGNLHRISRNCLSHPWL
jgi:hypothetical protein